MAAITKVISNTTLNQEIPLSISSEANQSSDQLTKIIVGRLFEQMCRGPNSQTILQSTCFLLIDGKSELIIPVCKALEERCNEQGRFQQSIKICNTVLKILETKRNSISRHDRALLLLPAGIAYREMYHYVDAFNYFWQAYQNVPEQKEICKAEIDKTHKQLREACKKSFAQNSEDVFFVYIELAKKLNTQGFFGEAIVVCESILEALKTSPKQISNIQKAEVLLHWGKALRDTGQYPAAIGALYQGASLVDNPEIQKLFKQEIDILNYKIKEDCGQLLLSKGPLAMIETYTKLVEYCSHYHCFLEILTIYEIILETLKTSSYQMSHEQKAQLSQHLARALQKLGSEILAIGILRDCLALSGLSSEMKKKIEEQYHQTCEEFKVCFLSLVQSEKKEEMFWKYLNLAGRYTHSNLKEEAAVIYDLILEIPDSYFHFPEIMYQYVLHSWAQMILETKQPVDAIRIFQERQTYLLRLTFDKALSGSLIPYIRQAQIKLWS